MHIKAILSAKPHEVNRPGFNEYSISNVLECLGQKSIENVKVSTSYDQEGQTVFFCEYHVFSPEKMDLILRYLKEDFNPQKAFDLLTSIEY